MHSIINLPVIAIAGAIISQFAMAEEAKLEGRGEELLSARCARCHAHCPYRGKPTFGCAAISHPVPQISH